MYIRIRGIHHHQTSDAVYTKGVLTFFSRYMSQPAPSSAQVTDAYLYLDAFVACLPNQQLFRGSKLNRHVAWRLRCVGRTVSPRARL